MTLLRVAEAARVWPAEGVRFLSAGRLVCDFLHCFFIFLHAFNFVVFCLGVPCFVFLVG